MKSLMIKDLEVTKALSREELVAVRGGSNFAFVFGPTQNAQNGGGFNNASPVTQTAPQTVTGTETTVQILNVLQSMNTAVSQAKLF